MKLQHVQQLIDHILRDVDCPYCRGPLERAFVDGFNATHQQLEFVAECPHCAAELVVNGVMQHKPNSVRKPVAQRVLSPDAVREITRRVRDFRGHDIRELLQS